MRPATESPSSPIFKVLAGVFVLFLILIISIANRGEGDRWWSFIHNIPFGDKLGHVGLMGTLSLLCNLAFPPRPVPFLPASITRVTFILFLLITLEELSQAFLPTRSCDPFDWLADLTGLALGQLTALAFKPSP
jgi:polysaccharide biosynthesis protein VpsQ